MLESPQSIETSGSRRRRDDDSLFPRYAASHDPALRDALVDRCQSRRWKSPMTGPLLPPPGTADSRSQAGLAIAVGEFHTAESFSDSVPGRPSGRLSGLRIGALFTGQPRLEAAARLCVDRRVAAHGCAVCPKPQKVRAPDTGG
jgi:hypothetical protein